MNNPPQTHDLMIVFDAVTGGTFGLAALKQAIPDIINFVALAGCFERIGVLAYRNYAYTAEKVVEWSGWCNPSYDLSSPSTDDILKFVKDLEMPDDSEYKLDCASKTAFAKVYQEIRSNGTIIFLYNHAPPLLEDMRGPRYYLEQMLLAEYGETGPLFGNWMKGVNALAGLASDKKAVVLSFSFGYADRTSDWSPYLYLSFMTEGEFYLTAYSDISRLTICLLLTWMQADGNINIPHSSRTTYKKAPLLLDRGLEANMEMFCGQDNGNLEFLSIHTAPRNCLRVPYGGVNNNNQQLSKFTSRNLARNYINCSEYSKNVIAKHIDRIIRTNVSVITIHPLFVQLWAAVCLDQTGNDIKRTFLERFKAHIDQISDPGDKRQAQTWLEKSYTFFHTIIQEYDSAQGSLGDTV
ncbi:dihydroxyacid dehydratase [Fusarium phyllophilum]|uniref:Dihydroxyacid dehydratase n=1 Tax=Fusarium phyllophilum TaxID=47803 RepID=A0A8H5NLG9_9HYPO|nr:dihydroxyacid dehydratase [Fusarium phyllophilum]